MYSMKDVCEEVGMPYETLKYYCNQGLVPNVKRDKNNYRVFNESDVKWIKDLACLKKCGMSINDMKKYLDYCLKGENSIPERKEFLNKKRAKLLEEKAEIEKSIAYIDWKQEFYDGVLSGKIKYQSNLINVDK